MKLFGSLYNIIRWNDNAGNGEKPNGGNEYVAAIALNAAHDIYKAHFPEHPITPGVVMIQIAREVASMALKRELRINEVKSAKFLNILSPTEATEVDVIVKEKNPGTISCRIEKNNIIYARIEWK